MEAWKIERFIQNHGEAFPPYRQLSLVECRQILERFATAFDVDGEDQDLKVLKKLLNLAVPINYANPFSDSFSLERWRDSFRPQVFVNWNHWGSVSLARVPPREELLS